MVADKEGLSKLFQGEGEEDKEGLSRVHIWPTIKCNPPVQDMCQYCITLCCLVSAPHKFYIGFRYVHPSTEEALEELERLVPRCNPPLPLSNMHRFVNSSRFRATENVSQLLL